MQLVTRVLRSLEICLNVIIDLKLSFSEGDKFGEDIFKGPFKAEAIGVKMKISKNAELLNNA